MFTLGDLSTFKEKFSQLALPFWQRLGVVDRQGRSADY